MATVGPFNYVSQFFHDIGNGSHAMSGIPANAKGFIVVLGSTSDIIGTVSIGGVTLTSIRHQGYYGRESHTYMAADISARTNDTITLSSMSGTIQMCAIAFAGPDPLYYRAQTGTNSWTVPYSRTYTLDDGVAEKQHLLGVFVQVGEAGGPYYCDNDGGNADDFAFLGWGGANDTGIGVSIHARASTTAGMTFGPSNASQGAWRFDQGLLGSMQAFPTFSIDAAIFGEQQASATLDAFITPPTFYGDFTLSAWQMDVVPGSFPANAVKSKYDQSGSFGLDAFITPPTIYGDFSIDTLKLATYQTTDQFVPSTNVYGSAWSRNSCASVTAPDIVTLINYAGSDTASLLSNETKVGTPIGYRIYFDQIELIGVADHFDVAIVDGSVAATRVGSEGLNFAGAYGFLLNIYGNRIQDRINGNLGGYTSFTPDTSAWGEWSIEFFLSGNDWRMRLYQGTTLRRTSNAFPAPPMSSWRIAAGARTGGFNGRFRVKGTPYAVGGEGSTPYPAGTPATIDAYFERGFLLSAEIVVTYHHLLRLDAYISEGGVTGEFSTDAVVHKESEASLGVDAALRRFIEAEAQADATILRPYEAGLTADGVVTGTQDDAVTADAWIEVTHSDVFVVGAVIVAEEQDTFQAEAVLTTTIDGFLDVDAIVRRVHTSSLDIGGWVLAIIVATMDLDAVVKGTVSGTLSVDAVRLRTASAAFSADGIRKRTAIATFSIGAIRKGTLTDGFATDAIRLSTETGSFGLDASITEWHYEKIEATFGLSTSADVISAAMEAATVEATFSSGTISWTGTAAVIEMMPTSSAASWTPVVTSRDSFSIAAVLV